jgi:tRNA(Ile)-lysidine synthase
VNDGVLNLNLSGFSRSARYLIGVSGGRDSVALLHALRAAGVESLTVCHLNHGLRRAAAAGDARFVAALAKRLGLETEIEKADVAQRAATRGQSIETAARAARYEFFARVARKRRCHNLFLAHHADDQVETFLFNLFRGTGRAGLGAINPDCERLIPTATGTTAPRSAAGVRLRLLRPMLGIWRREIDGYIAAHRLRYREDASNLSPDHTRNRIRHELLPIVETVFGRDVRPAVWRAAEILRAEEEWLAGLAGVEVSEELAVPELRSQPVAQQRRRILDWLRRQGVPDTSFEQVETVRSLLQGEHAKVNLPGNWHARRREKRLFLERPA